MRMDRALLTIFTCSALVAMSSPASAGDLVIHAGQLIDGVSKTPRSHVSILIHDDRITGVQPGYVTPAGVDVIDLSTETVLPGLIDCHVHLLWTFHKGDPVRKTVTRSSYDNLIDGVNDARATLMAGFTSVRDVGGETEAVIALKHAVDAGTVPGPRMWVSGYPLGPTGGHGDPLNGLNDELFKTVDVADPVEGRLVIDGPEAAQKAVRLLHREGVDLIKIMPSGGVTTVGDDPAQQVMSNEEIKAVVDTAHALDMKVAAHAHGEKAINNALSLGVDSIEHGTYGDAASYALFKQKGAYLVPTLLVQEKVYERARDHPEDLNPSAAAKALMVAPLAVRNLHDAYLSGVKIAFGTDTFGLSAHGDNAQEFSLMVKAGMTPADAISAATFNAADLIGDSPDIGSVQAGRYADIVAVKGDPLKDISVLEDMDFVMKAGKVYKYDGRPVQ